MYGAVCAKVAEEMRKPDVAEFFASLIQRTSPKSWPQAMAELVVTRRFFENFSGDQVSAQQWQSSTIQHAVQRQYTSAHSGGTAVHSSAQHIAALHSAALAVHSWQRIAQTLRILAHGCMWHQHPRLWYDAHAVPLCAPPPKRHASAAGIVAACCYSWLDLVCCSQPECAC